MSLQETAQIQFDLLLTPCKLYLPDSLLHLINNLRNLCKARKWLGTTPTGTGYGNISLRLSQRSFTITGTQTAHLDTLSSQHLCIATEWHLNTSTLHAIGKVKPSSEALTHAACYEATPLASAVIHIHDKTLWTELFGRHPTTDKTAHAGTPRLATEVLNTVSKHTLLLKKEKALWIVLGGHYEGLLIILTGEGIRQWLNAKGAYPSSIAHHIGG